MLTFALLSTLLILSTICTVDDGLDSDSPSLTSTIIAQNIHGHDLYIEPVFYGDFVQPLQRRLLEHPRRAKQIYRSHDYHDYVAREYRPRRKLDESRSYRSSANDEDGDDDEDEDEDEDEEGDEEEKENKLDDDNSNDESADGETAEQNEEETVAIAARNRVGRSDYMILGDEASERERREVRSTSEECEDEPTEPSQYYEYETELRNVASQDKRRAILLVKVIGASSLLILLLV